MARVERFEDLIAWQKARLLSARLFEVGGKGSFAKDFSLRDQVNRASASVAANIAEGFERGSRADFARFLVYAKGSCGELRSHIHLARDRGYLDQGEYDDVLEAVTEVAKVVAGLLTAVRRQRATAPPANVPSADPRTE